VKLASGEREGARTRLNLTLYIVHTVLNRSVTAGQIQPCRPWTHLFSKVSKWRLRRVL